MKVVCKRCRKYYTPSQFGHKCNEIMVFHVWLDEHLEDAVDQFRTSLLFKFELFYQSWRSTHKLL